MHIQKNTSPLLLTTCFTALFLTACGGGGGSSSGSDGVASTDTTNTENTNTNQDNTDTDNNPTNSCQLDANEQDMLDQVNAARASGYTCGSDDLPAVSALTWNCDLEAAALSHSTDMATNNFFSHTGSDGLSVSNRVDAQNYNWSAVGENIAAGQTSVTQVVTGWLNSEGHCRNIMNGNFTEFGSSRVDSATADYPTYWTQVFARPR
ncbi:CAP domain-containing protein [Litoribrevibacter euphylliae]|uniref:CAP domain-containing protein n=1 Tax=Litoribrevibacter euphylliae TaxID=1834034 RepID=A0ABV7HBX1_9GAMM